MSDEFDEAAEEGIEDVSTGKNADPRSAVDAFFGRDHRKKFEIYSYRNAAAILANSFPAQYASIIGALNSFAIGSTLIRLPGGSKGPIAKYVDTLFTPAAGWVETRLSADLHVKLLDAKKKDFVFSQYTSEGFLDGHRIDFLQGRVALDFEWNSKDQTYDRDLYAFSAFYEAGAIDVGVIITRGASLDSKFFRSLGRVLKADGSEGDEEVHKKFGASTTWIGKLLYRLDAGRNGGCPVLAIGITPACIT